MSGFYAELNPAQGYAAFQQDTNVEHRACFSNCFCAHIFAYDESIGLVCLENGVADEPFVNYEDAFSIGKAAADDISRKDLSLHRNNHVITIMSAKN